MDSVKELEKEIADLKEEWYVITHLNHKAFIGTSQKHYAAYIRLVSRLENKINDLKKEHELLKQRGLT